MEELDIKAILTDRKLDTEEELKNIQESAAPVVPDVSIGRLSRMDAINQKSIFDASVANLKRRLEQIDRAFKRLENDEYGYCLMCEEEIGEKRLKAVPESPFCVRCMQSKET